MPRYYCGCGDPSHMVMQCPPIHPSSRHTTSTASERESAPPARGQGRGQLTGRGGRSHGRGADQASGSRGAQCYAFSGRPEADISETDITGMV